MQTHKGTWKESDRGVGHKSFKGNPVEAGKAMSTAWMNICAMDDDIFEKEISEDDTNDDIPNNNGVSLGVQHVGRFILQQDRSKIIKIQYLPDSSESFLMLRCSVFNINEFYKFLAKWDDTSIGVIANVVNQVMREEVAHAISYISDDIKIRSDYAKHISFSENLHFVSAMELLSLCSIQSQQKTESERNTWLQYHTPHIRSLMNKVNENDASKAMSNIVAYCISHKITSLQTRIVRKINAKLNHFLVANVTYNDVIYLTKCIFKMLSEESSHGIDIPEYDVPYLPNLIRKDDEDYENPNFKYYKDYSDLMYDDESFLVGLNRITEHMPEYKPIAFHKAI